MEKMPETSLTNGYTNGHNNMFETEDGCNFLFTSESVGEGHPGTIFLIFDGNMAAAHRASSTFIFGTGPSSRSGLVAEPHRRFRAAPMPPARGPRQVSRAACTPTPKVRLGGARMVGIRKRRPQGPVVTICHDEFKFCREFARKVQFLQPVPKITFSKRPDATASHVCVVGGLVSRRAEMNFLPFKQIPAIKKTC